MWLFRKKNNRYHKGQNLLEYATVAAVVTAAVVAMSTYMFRSVQATQQAIQEEYQKSQ
jgi:Flp pilus assembly pilin Flp